MSYRSSDSTVSCDPEVLVTEMSSKLAARSCPFTQHHPATLFAQHFCTTKALNSDT